MEFYSVQEIAGILKLDPVTIRRYIKDGKIRCIKFGKDYRITKENFMEFIKRVENNPGMLRRKINSDEKKISL